jgi:hypothetical protein
MKNLAPDLRPGYLDRRGLAVSISHNETGLVVLIRINVPSTGSRFHLWLASWEENHMAPSLAGKSPQAGPVRNAQRLAADNRLVGGSSPLEPTTQSRANRDFPARCE